MLSLIENTLLIGKILLYVGGFIWFSTTICRMSDTALEWYNSAVIDLPLVIRRK